MIDVRVAIKFNVDPVKIEFLINAMTAPLVPLWQSRNKNQVAVAERLGNERIERMKRAAKGRRLPA
jgi:hypothetical protein